MAAAATAEEGGGGGGVASAGEEEAEEETARALAVALIQRLEAKAAAENGDFALKAKLAQIAENFKVGDLPDGT